MTRPAPRPMYWLSYGGGVNSTALLVLLATGKLPEYDPWRVVFADTGCERDQTYAYLTQIKAWLRNTCGKEIETVYPKETVLARWERFRITGSRIHRSCTDHAKVKPIAAHLTAESDGHEVIQLIGIDAGELHRATPARIGTPEKRYPLVDLGIDRAGCVDIIKGAGLCVPMKSGCWCCPFMRVDEVVTLAREYPERFERIAALEAASIEAHPVTEGKVRAQWGDKPCAYWRERAAQPVTADLFEDEDEQEGPCDCFR